MNYGWASGARAAAAISPAASSRCLAFARSLITNPALLLLDEPLEGLAPIIVEELAVSLKKMIELHGTAAILVEQHVEVALSLTEEAIVIERGAIAHRGRSRDLPSGMETLERLVGLKVISQ